MRPITVVRFWYGMSGFFVVALVANLVVVLRQPIFSWRDAIPLRLFFFTFLSLYWLEKAHRKLKASPDAVIEISAGRYLLVGLVVAVAVTSFLIGISSRLHIAP
jgi:hypothetical protein